MIYSVNRYSSMSDDMSANSKYYGAGAFGFMAECARDELEIFENAITTDMHEVMLGESSYEMEAVNEGFFENAWNKIKEIFKKFIEWIKAVTRSAVAKLASLLIRDNKEFAKFARKKINEMKNRGKFEYSGKVLVMSKLKSPLDLIIDKAGVTESDIERIADILITIESRTLNSKIYNENSAKVAEDKLEKMNEVSVSDIMDDITDDATDAKISDVMDHLKVLETLSKNDINKIKKSLDKYEKICNKVIKKVEKLERDVEDKDKYNKDNDKRVYTGGAYKRTVMKNGEMHTSEEKIYHNHADAKAAVSYAVRIANSYKSCAQSLTTLSLSLIKSIAKLARTVVAKAAGATPKNEGFEYDEMLLDSMNEAVLYEYDEALESTDSFDGDYESLEYDYE